MRIPVAAAPGSFALIAAPEALPGFERLASGNGWHNEINVAGLLIPFARFRPVQKAARIAGPVLVQLGERDGMVPRPAIENVSARAPRGQLARYPMNHFDCYWPEHIERVAGDQLTFLRQQLLTPKTHHTRPRASGPDAHRTRDSPAVAHPPSRA